MPYAGSYIWGIRQKIGHDYLIMPSTDTVAVSEDGRLLLAFNKDSNLWTFPGGYVEKGASWQESAARELAEEGGIIARPEDFIPFAIWSGAECIAEYANGDQTQYFLLAFIVTKWQEQTNDLDFEEVDKAQFFTLDEITTLDMTPSARHILSAYKEYKETGIFQIC